jgi:hypothetical protein
MKNGEKWVDKCEVNFIMQTHEPIINTLLFLLRIILAIEVYGRKQKFYHFKKNIQIEC